MLQDRLETQFPRPQIVRIHRDSGGNPLAALALADPGQFALRRTDIPDELSEAPAAALEQEARDAAAVGAIAAASELAQLALQRTPIDAAADVVRRKLLVAETSNPKAGGKAVGELLGELVATLGPTPERARAATAIEG